MKYSCNRLDADESGRKFNDIVKIEWLLIGTGFFIMVLSLIMSRNRALVKAGKQVEEVN